ncbi:hypothetical protein SDC9_173497 [bioreactor metagenome]|uniref:Uncharacterized protein n=1 Tax=bioreactor metagenome TaxID=1076179 RepID=A0A645GHA9_9ZZZZ
MSASWTSASCPPPSSPAAWTRCAPTSVPNWPICQLPSRSASPSLTASTTCCPAYARRLPSRSSARIWTCCAPRPTPCANALPACPASPTCRLKSRCWHRRSASTSTTRPQPAMVFRHRRSWPRCRPWSRARRSPRSSRAGGASRWCCACPTARARWTGWPTS